MSTATATRPRTWSALKALTGGLSAPGKMPGPGWSIPATACKVGSLLRKKPGSVCRFCYALKGRYVFPNVRDALQRRLDAFESDPAGWIAAMVESIDKSRTDCFRWFDSGDLQSLEMLDAIVSVAEQTPTVAHWLPTRERAIVREYLESARKLPANLTVRLSAAMVGAPAPTGPAGTVASVVRAAGESPRPGERRCPAPEQGNKCGSCRACFSSEVPVVSYGVH